MINYNLINYDSLFLLLTNYILNISIALFFGYYNNYFLSLIAISFLVFMAILLIKDFKNIFGTYLLTTIPYLLTVSFSFVYISITFIQHI